ncbi:MAG: hypothetical protein ACRC8Z_05000, partial [Empedobacter falsenii]
YKQFDSFGRVFGVEKYTEDLNKWVNVPSNNPNASNPSIGVGGCYTSIAQVMEWQKNRIIWMNSQYLN